MYRYTYYEKSDCRFSGCIDYTQKISKSKKVDVNLQNLKLALIINFSVDYSLIKKGVVRTNHGRGKQNT